MNKIRTVLLEKDAWKGKIEHRHASFVIGNIIYACERGVIKVKEAQFWNAKKGRSLRKNIASITANGLPNVKPPCFLKMEDEEYEHERARYYGNWEKACRLFSDQGEYFKAINHEFANQDLYWTQGKWGIITSHEGTRCTIDIHDPDFIAQSLERIKLGKGFVDHANMISGPEQDKHEVKVKLIEDKTG